jgi:hypothetical protein
MQPNSKATSEKFYNLLDFYGEELAKYPDFRMKNHPLSPICHYPQYLEAISTISSMREFHTMVTNGWLTDLNAEQFIS